MSILQLNTNQFSFDKNDRVLSAEASTLGMFIPPYHLKIQSVHTSQIKNFRQKEEVTDAEGDIQYWVFSPDKPIKNIDKVIIWND